MFASRREKLYVLFTVICPKYMIINDIQNASSYVYVLETRIMICVDTGVVH